MQSDQERYSRQVRVPQIGTAGQARLAAARVALIGCGALGSVSAGLLVRAGVGFLRVVDRDFIELHNLQRQSLFDECDLAANLPKAEAAARKLRQANGTVQVESVVADVNPQTIPPLVADADVILDGTDNLETRYLINDAAVAAGKPWVYGACIGVEGRALAIVPGVTPCLRCIWPDAPPPGTVETCDTAGVLAPAVHIVASWQVCEVLKLLLGKTAELAGLITGNAWTGRSRSVDVRSAYAPSACVCCGQRRFEYLRGTRWSAVTALCGRDAVQILPAEPTTLDLGELAARLPQSLAPEAGGHLLRLHAGPLTITVFRDGRAIVQGTTDATAARAALAKYVGV